MRLNPPLRIVITGPDGSGKSTTCRMVTEALCSAFPGERVREVQIWDALSPSGPFAAKEQVVAYIGTLSGQARTLFIFQLYAQALALAQDATIQVLNGHWFKYAVSELGYGVSEEAVFGAARGFPAVDHTYFLAIDPAEAWRRRERASVYEQGLIGGVSHRWLSVQEQFVVFQRHLGRYWQEMAKRTGPWTVLDHRFDKEARAKRIISDILDLRADRAA